MSTEHVVVPTAECSVAGCNDKIQAKGLCNRHYQRMRKHGDPLGGGPSTGKGKTPIERFWSSIDKTDSCWLWTAGTDVDGYGVLKVDGKSVKAHRFSYQLEHGPIPEGMFVCHHCDCPPCVNPSHLFLGSAADNNEDMSRKGRVRRQFGASNARSKLTEAQVREIKASQAGTRSLAEHYGVSDSAIRDIRNGRRWAHV